MATLTGLEPATSAVTGRRANQLRHRALLSCVLHISVVRTPNGIRTRATAVKGRRPRPLDDGGLIRISPGHSSTSFVGSFDSLGYRCPNPQTVWSQHQFASSCTLSSRAPIAQLVELRTFNPQVVGSSPTGGTRRPPKGGFTVAVHALRAPSVHALRAVAISSASGAIVAMISPTVAAATPASVRLSPRWPATRLKWCMVIPRP